MRISRLSSALCAIALALQSAPVFADEPTEKSTGGQSKTGQAKAGQGNPGKGKTGHGKAGQTKSGPKTAGTGSPLPDHDFGCTLKSARLTAWTAKGMRVPASAKSRFKLFKSVTKATAPQARRTCKILPDAKYWIPGPGNGGITRADLVVAQADVEVYRGYSRARSSPWVRRNRRGARSSKAARNGPGRGASEVSGRLPDL